MALKKISFADHDRRYAPAKMSASSSSGRRNVIRLINLGRMVRASRAKGLFGYWDELLNERATDDQGAAGAIEPRRLIDLLHDAAR